MGQRPSTSASSSAMEQNQQEQPPPPPPPHSLPQSLPPPPPCAPPPAYTQHEPNSFHLPSVPTHLPLHLDRNDHRNAHRSTHRNTHSHTHSHSHTPSHSHGRLPGIKSLQLPATTAHHTPHNSVELSPPTQYSGPPWGSLSALSSPVFSRLPDDAGSPMETASVLSSLHHDGPPRETSLSIDDPDVRLAAEALSGLGNPDFVRSPTAQSIALSPRNTAAGAGAGAGPATAAEPEPLLSLITSNHPWLGNSINGSISAYNATKGYTPRFVQYGAELIERNIGSPVVNTVSSVGRRTGMDKNLRRYLGEGHRRLSDLEQGDTDRSRTKRQRIASPGHDAMDLDEVLNASRTRGSSHSSYAESLPAYDDQRSPNYEEAVRSPAHKLSHPHHPSGTAPDRPVPWSTQLIMTTSGLGVALSETSLRSLKLCLSLLRSATTHIDSVMRALKLVLEEYEAALRSQRTSSDDRTSATDEKAQLHGTMAHLGLVDGTEHQDDQVRRIADRIKALSANIWKTLQSVVSSVSRYTGGALPENASRVVRTQLLSVPQRWQLAGLSTHTRDRQADAETGGGGGGGDEVRGANRMLAFAKEGLDMMSQITTVVDGTVQSAEGWLARIGRGPTARGEAEAEAGTEAGMETQEGEGGMGDEGKTAGVEVETELGGGGGATMRM